MGECFLSLMHMHISRLAEQPCMNAVTGGENEVEVMRLLRGCDRAGTIHLTFSDRIKPTTAKCRSKVNASRKPSRRMATKDVASM
jgi:hypothetical protein